MADNSLDRKIFKRHMKNCHIDLMEREKQAADRPKWKSLVKISGYEARGQIELGVKRDEPKARPLAALIYHYYGVVIFSMPLRSKCVQLQLQS